jgi:hypothetical protein
MRQNEDSDLSLQQLVFSKWKDEWDQERKAHIERIAEEMGCTWRDIVMDCRDLFLDESGHQGHIND